MKRPLIVVMSVIVLSGCAVSYPPISNTTATTSSTTSTQPTIPTAGIDDLDKIITIDYIGVTEPNSVGGVDWRVRFDNKADRDIKYITFTVQAYNAVNDPVSDEITNRSIQRCKLTGPVKAGATEVKVVWDTIWYNETIDVSKLLKIEIEYMDEKTIVIEQSVIEQMEYTSYHN